MKCTYPDCKQILQGDIEEILDQGFGFCARGHMSVLPGSTKIDSKCECGARKAGLPVHSSFCPEYKKD